ncbi:MAG: DNA replication and repair protein RecF [Candidatus Neomarinimicrobiota bacterium]
MVLKKLRLVNFRRYTDSIFEFHEKTNFINGDNGSGKTSILEAVHYLSLTKSFRTSNDNESIRYNNDFLNIFGEFLNEHNKTNLHNLNFSRSEGKSFLLNKIPVKKYTDIVGAAPVVILSPGLQKITEGGPAERRNFINRILSQTDREYFINLIEYKKRLTQRNLVINRYRENKSYHYDVYFETQDDILARIGQKLFSARQIFLTAYKPMLKDIFTQINHTKSQIDLNIKYNIKSSIDDFIRLFSKNLKDKFSRDLQNGRTSCGPHLDELVILYNGREIRQIGSQGEHKLVLIALKLAEGAYLENRKNEPIIFLLDDLFAFLDGNHCRKIVENIGDRNQTLITSTDIKELRKYGFRKILESTNIINLTAGVA